MSTSTDVVIVGARPTGASLALRLAKLGLAVTVVDRATFPSLPQVPSNPVLYASSMALLDELGVDEAAYAPGATKLARGFFEFEGHFRAELRFPTCHGRAYALGIDRADFDGVLRRALDGRPGVTVREGFAVASLVTDAAGAVSGVTSTDGQTLLARVVIGADGRFSKVATLAGLEVCEEHAAHTSTVHFAEWEGLRPVAGEAEGVIHLVTRARGKASLLLPHGPGRVSVATQVRTPLFTADDAEAHYRAVLAEFPAVTRRLEGARRVTPLVGLKRVGNGYRTVGKPGVFLAGDAVHFKDPLDGQGIYDALLGTKLLAPLVAAVARSEKPWPQALAEYRDSLWAHTQPMFKQTTQRLKRELYDEPPAFVISTVLRSMLEDEQYQRAFLRLLARDVDPNGWLSPGLVAGSLWRGAGRGLRRLFGAAPNPPGAPA